MRNLVKGFSIFIFALFLVAGTSLVQAQNSPQSYITAGTYTFTVPNGVKTITVQTWGGGGRGGGGTGSNLRLGGGGGGAFATSVIAVSPSQEYIIIVGAGGNDSNVNGGNTRLYLSTNPSVDLVRAAGGTGVVTSTAGGAGGTVANSVGTTRYEGGTGATGDGVGGGGGSSAGTAAAGNNGVGASATTAPTGGGDGGAGVSGNVTGNGSPGGAPGGGGGGGRTQGNSTASGGNGGVGRAVLTFQKVDATQTTVEINKTSVLADNTDQAILTIHAKDPSGANITNLVLGDFGFTGHASATIADFTNTGGGIYTFTIKSNTIQTINITVTILNVNVGSTGDISFIVLAPTVQSSNIQFSSITANSMSIQWTIGNGAGRIVLARSESAVDSGPVDDVIYTADDDFSGSPDEIGTDNFVVYTGSGNSFNLTGLDQNTRYYFTIYEYNVSGSIIRYLSTTPPTANQITKANFELTFTGVKGWRMIALPLQSTTYADVFNGPGLVTQGFTGSTNPSDAPNLLWYIESQTGTDNQRWAKPLNITNTVVPGRGYMYYVFGNVDGDGRYNDEFPIGLSVEAFETELSAAEFDFSVTYTAAADSGWNLLGNPFVGDLDWDNEDEWTKTNMMNAIYVWDPSANAGAGDYLTWSFPTGDVALGGLIAKGQSFLVKANGVSPELNVTRNAVTTGATFFKKEMEKETSVMAEDDPGIHLMLRKNQYEKSTYITFNENSSRALDIHDAYFLQSLSDTYLAFYTESVEKQNLTINSLPRRFNTPIEIPIYIGGFENGTSLSGNYEVALGELTNIPISWGIELIDKKSNQKVIWKTPGEPTFRNEIGIGPASIKSKQIDSNTNSTNQDDDRNEHNRFIDHFYGFEFKYEEPLQINSPKPGDPIIMQTLPGTTQSRFVLRISPNGEFYDIPEDFVLYQNYPNPFNPTTSIQFGLPLEENIRLDVFDVLGRQITTLAQGVYSAGNHTVQFDARSLVSGVYLVRMQTGKRVQTMKMLLVK